GPVRLPLVHRDPQRGSDDGRDPPPRRGAIELTLQSGRPQGQIEPRNTEEIAMDDKTRTELEAATFRRLVQHLRERTDVQNIDLMNLAGFCRNCLSNWLKDAADAKGVSLTKDESREAIYGMPYETWKATHQGSASAEQLAAMKKAQSGH